MQNCEGLVGFYINLDKRDDRRDHFEKNVKNHPFFSNIQRMSAIYHEVKGAGCTLSHIECLRRIKMSINNNKSSARYYVIMEDDFQILDSDNFNHFVNSFEKIKDSDSWDIILLTPRGLKMNDSDPFMSSNGYSRISHSQTATGYILKSHMIDVLLENYINSYVQLINTCNYIHYALDQTWKNLQLNHNFYYYLKIYAGQLPGWSDLEKTFVDYNYGFLIQ